MTCLLNIGFLSGKITVYGLMWLIDLICVCISKYFTVKYVFTLMKTFCSYIIEIE